MFYMSRWTLVLKRIRFDKWSVATGFATMLMATTLLVAGPMFSERVLLAGARQTLVDAPPPETALSISLSTTAAGDPDLVDQHITSIIVEAAGALNSSLVRTGTSPPFTLPQLEDTIGNALTPVGLFMFRDDIDHHVTLIEGTWFDPVAGDGPLQVVISESTAHVLGLSAGQQLALEPRPADGTSLTIEVRGVFRLNDHSSNYWLGDPLWAEGFVTGSSFATYGPFVVHRDAFFSTVATRSRISWLVQPELESVSLSDLPELRRNTMSLVSTLESDSLIGQNVTVETRLPAILREIDTTQMTTRVSILTIVGQLAIVAAYALFLMTRLQLDRRREELTLLRARGTSNGQILQQLLRENVVLVVPVIALAPWVAAASLSAFANFGLFGGAILTGLEAPNGANYLHAWLAGVGIVIFTLVPAAIGLRSTGNRTRSAKSTLWQRGHIDLVLVVLALLGLWQLRRYGAPITATVQGRLDVDPLLIIAPALGLLAGTILTLRILPHLSRLVGRSTRAGNSLVFTLGGWQLQRRQAWYSRMALLLVMASAIGVYSLAYSRTWQTSQHDQAGFAVGADLRSTPSRRPGSLSDLYLPGMYSTLNGVTNVSPVIIRSQPLSRNTPSAQLLIIDSASAPDIVAFRDDLASDSIDTLMAQLEERRPYIETIILPGDAAQLILSVRFTLDLPCPALDDADSCGDIDLSVPGAKDLLTAPVSFAAVVRDADGYLHRIHSDTRISDGDTGEIVFPLQVDANGSTLFPTGPLELVAIEFTAWASPTIPRNGSLELLQISTTTSDQRGQAVPVRNGPEQWEANVTALGSFPGVGQQPSIRIASSQAPSLAAVDFATGSVTAPGTQAYPAIQSTFSIRPAGLVPQGEMALLASDTLLDMLAIEPGQTFAIQLGLREQPVVIAGRFQGFPTFNPDELLLIADWQSFSALYLDPPGQQFPAPQEYWLAIRNPGEQADGIAAALTEAPFNSSRVVSQHEQFQQLSNDPVAMGTIGILWLGFLTTITLAATGFVSGTVMSLQERRAEIGVLRVLGLTTRQLSSWLVVENGLLVGFSLVFGSLVGLVVAWITLPFVTLSRAVAAPFPAPQIHIPWGILALMNLAMVLLLVGTSLLATRYLQGIRLSQVLKIGGGGE